MASVTKNYLCTNDLFGPAGKVFDVGRLITWGRGGVALEISSFNLSARIKNLIHGAV